jgi:hypothetical protein
MSIILISICIYLFVGFLTYNSLTTIEDMAEFPKILWTLFLCLIWPITIGTIFLFFWIRGFFVRKINRKYAKLLKEIKEKKISKI